MAQIPYSQLPPVKYTHIVAPGTVFVNTGAVLGLNINSMGTTSAAAVSIYDTIGTIAGTVEMAAMSFPTTYAFPNKIDFGPAGTGFALNTGTVAIVTTNTIDITLAHR